MANEMTLVCVEAQTTAVVRARIGMADIPAAMFPMMDKVWSFIRSRSLTGHGHNVWLYRNLDGGEMDVEIGVQMEQAFDGGDDVVPSQTPAGMAAHTVHYGEYDQMPLAHRKLMMWCAEHGHGLAGVNWEVYGDWSDDPAKRRTDIYHLCTDAAPMDQ